MATIKDDTGGNVKAEQKVLFFKTPHKPWHTAHYPLGVDCHAASSIW